MKTKKNPYLQCNIELNKKVIIYNNFSYDIIAYTEVRITLYALNKLSTHFMIIKDIVIKITLNNNIKHSGILYAMDILRSSEMITVLGVKYLGWAILRLANVMTCSMVYYYFKSMKSLSSENVFERNSSNNLNINYVVKFTKKLKPCVKQ